MLKLEEGMKHLQDRGAKLTAQRIAIMASLENRRDHPSAEMIFSELKPLYPTLSIATVYSTAHLLAQVSMIRILSIDEKRVFFDPDTNPHAHFMCTKCKRIIDMRSDHEMRIQLKPEDGIFSIDSTEVFHYGLCSNCGNL
ncbi:MAG: transcriptional repressor [Synergistaceae bacterium]|jgi:Fur family peroxide stress response transcriptional regulator|nr:transcriptional repressor [Synergistaceae bacterium]